MHAARPLVASALVDGSLRLDPFSAEGLSAGHRVKVFDEASCRALAFAGSEAGTDVVLVGSSTGELAIVDVCTGQVQQRLPGAHEEAATCSRSLDGSLMACGDESGGVKVWDLRSCQSPVQSWQPHSDYVSSLTWHAPHRAILSVSGHPESVEAVVKLDEDTIATGSSDGMIRVLTIQPNKLLGVLGEHADFPIERLALSFDGQTLASASHDQTVRLWDLGGGDDEGDAGDEDERQQEGVTEIPTHSSTASSDDGSDEVELDDAGSAPESDEDEDGGGDDDKAEGPASTKAVESGDEDSDSSDDSSDDDDRRRKQRGRGKGAHRIPTKTAHKRSANASFFADLL